MHIEKDFVEEGKKGGKKKSSFLPSWGDTGQMFNEGGANSFQITIVYLQSQKCEKERGGGTYFFQTKGGEKEEVEKRREGGCAT